MRSRYSRLGCGRDNFLYKHATSFPRSYACARCSISPLSRSDRRRRGRRSRSESFSIGCSNPTCRLQNNPAGQTVHRRRRDDRQEGADEVVLRRRSARGETIRHGRFSTKQFGTSSIALPETGGECSDRAHRLRSATRPLSRRRLPRRSCGARKRQGGRRL